MKGRSFPDSEVHVRGPFRDGFVQGPRGTQFPSTQTPPPFLRSVVFLRYLGCPVPPEYLPFPFPSEYSVPTSISTRTPETPRTHPRPPPELLVGTVPCRPSVPERVFKEFRTPVSVSPRVSWWRDLDSGVTHTTNTPPPRSILLSCLPAHLRK